MKWPSINIPKPMLISILKLIIAVSLAIALIATALLMAICTISYDVIVIIGVGLGVACRTLAPWYRKVMQGKRRPEEFDLKYVISCLAAYNTVLPVAWKILQPFALPLWHIPGIPMITLLLAALMGYGCNGIYNELGKQLKAAIELSKKALANAMKDVKKPEEEAYVSPESA